MANKYCIYICCPHDYAHTETFREVAEGLQSGFSELGFVAPIVRDLNGTEEAIPIVLGANTQPLLVLPKAARIFNLEQVGTSWFSPSYPALLSRHEVWDYSRANVEWLSNHGIAASYCGIGYEPTLTRIGRASEDIDVLFYGSCFGRRNAIIRDVERTGLRTKTLFGVYGRERDGWIARSKCVLNIHAYDENGPFEIVRCSYLLANKKFIISEEVSPDFAWLGLVEGTAKEIPDLCQLYAADTDARETFASRGFLRFSSTRQSEYLKDLINP